MKHCDGDRRHEANIMTETSAEIIILTINALGAGILIFIADVLQNLMNEMDPPTFKRFLGALNRTAMSDPFLVTIATLPLIAAIPYFLFYGFGHWWFTAGFALWLIGSTITKVTNMPVYQWVVDPTNDDPEELDKKRHQLQLGNSLRAWTTFASVLLMTAQFGVREVLIVVVFAAIITFPLLWWARKYIPG
jgi:hypothetical protein